MVFRVMGVDTLTNHCSKAETWKHMPELNEVYKYVAFVTRYCGWKAIHISLTCSFQSEHKSMWNLILTYVT